MIVKYFEATSKRFGGVAYYAAYTLEDAKARMFETTNERLSGVAYYGDYSSDDIRRKVKTHSELNSQLVLKEIDLSTIPKNNVIHAVNLDDEQTKILTDRTMDIARRIIEHGINA